MGYIFSGCFAVIATVSSLDAAGETDRQWILPWVTCIVSEVSEREQAEILTPRLVASDLRCPLGENANIGWCGAGVKLLKVQAELVAADPRAGQLLHLFRRRYSQNWKRVIARDKPYRLVFSAS